MIGVNTGMTGMKTGSSSARDEYCTCSSTDRVDYRLKD
jgi:hypothetical protein